jgi:predicted ATPase/DNA-binding SARP family transcriptional activator
MGPRGSADISFGVLGSIEVRGESGLLPIGSARQRTLLALLLVHVNEVVSVDRLVDVLWGDTPPAAAVHTVHGLVSRVRAVIGTGRLVTEPPGYAVRLPAHELDALSFERSVAQARDLAESDEPAKAVALLDDALASWRGSAYAEFADRPWAQPEAARLTELRAAAIEVRAEWLLTLGQGHRVVTDLEGALVDHPLREGMHGLRMVALARSGRPVEALRAYEQFRKVLAEEVGLAPSSALQRLNRDILRQQPDLDWELGSAATTATATGGNRLAPARSGLPVVLTELVGRRTELAVLAEELAIRRLVTVVGPAGVGKTRVAIELCRSVVDVDDRAVAWVDLAPLADAEPIASTFATALRAPQHDSRSVWESVLGYLAGRQILLVVDNCEHVVEELASLVTDLLGAGPGVTVLATSREPLGLDGERTFLLRPLDVPDVAADLTAVGAVDAVALFVDRAHEVRPDFELTTATAGPVADICRRLDGLPLAIELAASRMAALGVIELAQRLDDRFAVLASGRRGNTNRHRTLEAAVDWSYNLLGDDEREAFGQLGVFPASFDLAAVESVVEPTTDPLAALSALVAKSLVTLDPQGDGSVRYRLLETLREFARLRLVASGTDDATRVRHAEHYADLAAEAATRMLGPEEPHWSDLVAVEIPNLRSAFQWACGSGRLDLALRLFTPLHPNSPLPAVVVQEIASWASTVAALPGAAAHPSFADVCAWGLRAADVAGDRTAMGVWVDRADQPGVARPARLLAQFAHVSQDFSQMIPLHEQAVDRANEQGDEFTLGHEMAIIALLMAMTAPGPGATAFGRRAVAACRRTGCPSLIAMGLMCLGLGLAETDPAEAVRIADEVDSYRDEMRTSNSAYRNSAGLKGRALIMQGDRSGLATYRRGLDEAVAVGDHMVARNSLWGVFEACALLGDDEHAAELVGGLGAACGELGTPFGPFAVRDQEVRARMGPARYDAARARAASWDWPELVDRARAIIDDAARN